jgi:hypothetical protein
VFFLLRNSSSQNSSDELTKKTWHGMTLRYVTLYITLHYYIMIPQFHNQILLLFTFAKLLCAWRCPARGLRRCSFSFNQRRNLCNTGQLGPRESTTWTQLGQNGQARGDTMATLKWTKTLTDTDRHWLILRIQWSDCGRRWRNKGYSVVTTQTTTKVGPRNFGTHEAVQAERSCSGCSG